MVGRTRASYVIAFALPLAYVGSVAAVVVHEVLGHGLTAAALGGTLRRFWVQLDLMGAATTSSPPEHRVPVLAAGVVASTLVGAVLVMLARRVRGPWLGLALAVVAAGCLHEGPPYALWNTVFDAGSGDMARLLSLVDRERVRPWLLVLSMTALVAGTWFAHLAIFRRCEDLLGPLSRGRAIALGVGMALVVTIGYGVFDWAALLGRSTPWPTLGALALGLLVAAGLVALRRAEVPTRSRPPAPAWRAVACAWTATGATVVAIALWLSHGVRFD